MSEAITKAVESIEKKLDAFAEKAAAEAKAAGSASAETKAALEKLGTEQHEFAQRLFTLEQRGIAGVTQPQGPDSMGEQFVKSEQFKAFASGASRSARVEVKNTVVGSDTTVAPDRRPGIVGAAQRRFLIESILNQSPTSSNAVEFTRENVFTNAAAETAEAAAKPESSITFTLVTTPVRTIAHWIRVSKQLAADNSALVAYINQRMVYGVNLRAETQLVVGDGTGANLLGLYTAGNYTAHGYTAANMTAWVSNPQRLDLIRRVYADCQLSDYGANAIILNPADWAVIETLKDTQGRYIVGNPVSGAAASLWGLPVVATAAMPADNFLMGAFDMACTQYNREGVTVAMSEEDASNFTTNLVTLRAERRLALAVERPASIRGGDLTPA